MTDMTKAPVYKVKPCPLIQTTESVVARGGIEQVAEYTADIIPFIEPARAAGYVLFRLPDPDVDQTNRRREASKKAHVSQ